ncbi:HNH endonuclease, partial [Exiguobacterium sp. E4787]|uniref:HNH endonuclease n=1 Tax=Exiguobacterium sp. E4787 TaxID=2751225 RepID=UPI001BE7EA24
MGKDEMEFSKDKSKKDGLTSACRECNNSREKIRRENGGEFSNEQKQKAFLLYGTACQICGSEFNLQVDHKLPQNICNPNKASVSENAWILCKSCNVSKGTKIIREIIKDVSKKTLGVNSGLKFPLNNGLKIPFLHITLGNYRHAPVGCRPVSFLSFD